MNLFVCGFFLIKKPNFMKIHVRSQPAAIIFEAILIPLRQDDFLAKNLAEIAEMVGCAESILMADFKADAKEILPLFGKTNRVFLLGLGKSPKLAEIVAASRLFCHKMKSKLPAELAVELRQFVDNQEVTWISEAISNGLDLGLYDISLYKTEEKKIPKLAELTFFVPENATEFVQKAAERGRDFAQTQSQIFNLLNAPGNKKRPTDLANWAVDSGKKHGFSTRVMLREDCEKAGLHAFLSVNNGSPLAPAFIIMEWLPESKTPGTILKTYGLVGKGITFDTGGISIKPSENMHLMKSDMGGAAAVFGTMEMAAKLNLQVHLVGIVPSTENMVDGKSTKPGDIISSYSGKTIEVIDTDAEGRIILADGLSYLAKNFAPDVMIDLATLTGSIVRMLGSNAAGLFSQNDELCAQLIRAGEQTGERLWRFPMWDVFADAMKSDIADVKNLSARPVSDAINAAKFLEHFTEKHLAWAHLDIAGVAFAAGDFATDRIATGFGVRLLVDFLENQ
jgi:leucyl aminopeptidase